MAQQTSHRTKTRIMSSCFTCQWHRNPFPMSTWLFPHYSLPVKSQQVDITWVWLVQYVNPCLLEYISVNREEICIFYYFPALGLVKYLELFLWEDKVLFILVVQFLGCCKPGDARREGINIYFPGIFWFLWQNIEAWTIYSTFNCIFVATCCSWVSFSIKPFSSRTIWQSFHWRRATQCH